MTMSATLQTLRADLHALGVAPGDGLFVHASLRALGPVEGGPAAAVEALLSTLGPTGLLAMPGFSTDASRPPDLDPAAMTPAEITAAEAAVPGHDPARSSAAGMGALAETFRTWPGTVRSAHPTTSICLNGAGGDALAAPHPLAWATGPDSPMGRLRRRPAMKILLIGVGWTRCSALHTAEMLAAPRRLKTRRVKTGPGASPWREAPDVADDLGRLFPAVGAAFEATGAVRRGRLAQADCRLCAYADLVDFAAAWISEANRRSGDRA